MRATSHAKPTGPVDPADPVEPTRRVLRADAERNRRRIIDAARVTFARRGLDVPLDAIAEAAGVGVATVYRRFPTKEDLLRAILEDRVEALLARFPALERIDDPWDAFAAAAEAFAGAIAVDRGFFQLFAQSDRPLPGEAAKRELIEALEPFLSRAQAAGRVREDLVILDVTALCSVAARMPSWRLAREPDLWRRYLAIVLDGLRSEAAHPLPHPPPRHGPAGEPLDPGAYAARSTGR